MMFELCSISTFILTCSVCISWYIYVLYRRRNVSKPKCAASTMIVLGSGGHTTEMLRLLSGMGDKYYPRYYIIADSDRISQEKAIAFEEKQQINKESQNFSIQRIPRSREVRQSWISTILTTIYASLYAFPIVFRNRPDLLLVNGPGTCIPLCLAAMILKIFKSVTLVYVESICRVDTLSLSGKILYYLDLGHHILVQWPQLKTIYPRTMYIGRIM